MSEQHEAKTVEIGTWVKVKDETYNEEEVFHITQFTDPKQNKIAPDTAFAQAFLGAKPGDKVSVDGPTGTMEFEVLDVGRS